MKKLLILLILGVVASNECYSQYARYLSASYILRNNGKFEGTQESTSTLWAGMTWSKRVSQKKYSVFQVETLGGIRISRTGYRMEATSPYPKRAFYDTNLAYSADSKLIQHLIGVPVGVDFIYKGNPVTAPGDIISMRVLVSANYLLSSNLKEAVDRDNTHSLSLMPYAKKFVPGITAELKFLAFLLGVTYQKVIYDVEAGNLNINESTGSPFYDMISNKGKFNDFYTYIGLELPLDKEKWRRKK